MSLPNAIIAGINKAGTTSLFRYLGDHPDVCVSSRKEIQFFNKALEKNEQLDLGEYESYFSHCTANSKIRLEASPRYLFAGGEVAQLIQTHLGDVKLIIALRDPIDRIESFFHSRKQKQEASLADIPTIDDFVNHALSIAEGNSNRLNHSVQQRISEQIEKGRYSGYLEEYLSHFSKDKISIVFFDDIVSDSQQVMIDLCKYLDIDPSFYSDYGFTVENRTRKYRFSALHKLTFSLNTFLEPILNRLPMVRRTIRSIYDALFEVKYEKEKMSPTSRKALSDFYYPSNQELANLLNREYPELTLPSWLDKSS
jgi:hypothetical protein